MKDSSKLASKFYGPYPVETKVGTVVYKLKLPVGLAIHPVFHVSLLKKKLGDDVSVSPELPPFSDDGEILLEPEAIREVQWVKRGKRFLEKCLIKWKNLPIEDASWEPADIIQNQFPTLILGDKRSLSGGGNDRIRRSSQVRKAKVPYVG